MGKNDKDSKKIEPPEIVEHEAPETETSESQQKESVHKEDGQKRPLYVVGMGASAGGLEAFEEFFKNMPPDTGMAFVLVPHLDPTHKGLMPELIQRFTQMDVVEVTDGMRVVPNHVYVIPPNKDMAIMRGVLQLLEPSMPRGLRMPIDFFFRQLAQDQGDRSVAIILSGMGTDGTLGIRAIKEKLGTVMVQDPQSAKYNGMPQSATATGLIDYIAPAYELPDRLLKFANQYDHLRVVPPTEKKDAAGALQKIFALVRTQTGNDFSLYKKSTVQRRIERRMSVHQITDINNYVRFIQENPGEINMLFKELLIGVTSFFREPEAFETLKNVAIPKMVAGKKPGDPIRVWVVGCSTGEEAYSIAIILKEYLSGIKNNNLAIQIYATDIDKEAIDVARQGIYPSNIAQDVSPERLERFFTKEDDHYRIKKEIREPIVFAAQSVIADPPFTKLDILSCRNLLIYLSTELQKKLMPLFHYALNPGGILFLGSSESTDNFTDLFEPIDHKWKLFERKGTSFMRKEAIEFPLSPITYEPRIRDMVIEKKYSGSNIANEAQKVIIQTIVPPVAIINDHGDILYTTRRTGKYLEPPVGKVNLNIYAMAREGLRAELSISVRKAIKDKQKVVVKGLRVKTNGSDQPINLLVTPLDEPETMRGLLMIEFEDTEPPSGGVHPTQEKQVSKSDLAEINKSLEEELGNTKEHLQTVLEQMQTSQEELKTANEELQSTNEELQSTNEEVVTSKEELQSLNEELTTLNSELQSKNEELTSANNDMANILNSTQIPTVFVDNNLNIKRFTPRASKIISLISADIGRPIADISSNLKYDGLVNDIKDVLSSLTPKAVETQTKEGVWYRVHIVPYRTTENTIEGAVITFFNISDFKKLEAELQKSKDGGEIWKVLDNWPSPVFIYDMTEKHNVYANQTASSVLGYPKEKLTRSDQDFWKSIRHPDEGEALSRWLKQLEYAKAGEILERKARMKTSDGEWHWFSEKAIVFARTPDGKPQQFLEIMEDITDIESSRRLRENLAHARERAMYAEDILNAIREPLIVLDKNLRVVSASPSFYRLFQESSISVEGKLLYDLGNRQWDIPALRTLLEKVLPQKAQVDDYLVEHDFPKIGHRKMLLNARRVNREDFGEPLILLVIEDVTDRKEPSSE